MKFGDLRPGDKFMYAMVDPNGEGGAADTLIKLDDAYTIGWHDRGKDHAGITNAILERTGSPHTRRIPDDTPVIFLSLERRPYRPS
ncbi:MAG: hypothetical protein Q7S28_01270 [bacterium]|nr:hypothetical protein [bacterium]